MWPLMLDYNAVSMPTVSVHAGTNLGRYRLIEQIGAGGMGVVFRAYDDCSSGPKHRLTAQFKNELFANGHRGNFPPIGFFQETFCYQRV